jgi:hypothetical protein
LVAARKIVVNTSARFRAARGSKRFPDFFRSLSGLMPPENIQILTGFFAGK